jgi:hypothetical protein
MTATETTVPLSPHARASKIGRPNQEMASAREGEEGKEEAAFLERTTPEVEMAASPSPPCTVASPLLASSSAAPPHAVSSSTASTTCAASNALGFAGPSNCFFVRGGFFFRAICEEKRPTRAGIITGLTSFFYFHRFWPRLNLSSPVRPNRTNRSPLSFHPEALSRSAHSASKHRGG